MYHVHFGLAAEPFNLTPDPAFLFLGRQHREALAALEYGIREGRGFVTLVGEVGTGKTTVVYSLISRLEEVSLAYLSTPAREFTDLLRSALKDFGVPVASPVDRLTLLDALNGHLSRMAEEGRPTALVIDEAQNLSDETFEALRMLSNFETYTSKLLQIVLVGQPELAQRLRQPRLRQLSERVSVRAVLAPLSNREMVEYIAHRLARVGGSLGIFEPGALRLLVRRAAGIPRRANILCHNALLFAYGRTLDRVTHSVAREAVQEMLPSRGRFVLRPLARWELAAGSAGMLGAALLLGFAGRSPVERQSAHAALSQRHDMAAPALCEAPPMPSPSVSPFAGHAPSEPAAPPAPSVEPILTDTPEPQAIEVVVPQGSTVLRLARQVYGRVLRPQTYPDFFTAVHRLNPELRDLDLIRPGERLRLPPASTIVGSPDEAEG